MLVSTMRELSCTTAAEALLSCAGLCTMLCKFMRRMRSRSGTRVSRRFSPFFGRQPCLPQKDNVCVAMRFPQCDIGTEAICACFQDVSHGESDGHQSQNCNAQNCFKKEKTACEEDKRETRLVPALVAARGTRERCAGSQTRRVQTDECKENRSIAEALGGAQLAPQGRRLSLGAVDADVPYQPRGQDSAE